MFEPEITYKNFDGNNEPTVNAKELWQSLEVKTPFRLWMPRRIEEAQFVEGQDFIVLNKNVQNPKVDRSY